MPRKISADQFREASKAGKVSPEVRKNVAKARKKPTPKAPDMEKAQVDAFKELAKAQAASAKAVEKLAMDTTKATSLLLDKVTKELAKLRVPPVEVVIEKEKKKWHLEVHRDKKNLIKTVDVEMV
jgi:hypothetical protein